MTGSLILVVEDDARLAATLQRVLTAEGHEVAIAGDGNDALRRARDRPPDLVILDVMLPGLDGIAVCRRLRATAQFPILMLTALGGTEQRVRGLDSGADDYLVKPFEFAELLARLRALLRRRGTRQYPVIEVGDLRLDTRSHRVTRGGDELQLTTKEYALLEYLSVNSGRVMGREEIAEHVWNEEFDPFSNLIEVYIGRLRRAVDRDPHAKLIHTLRGSGYILEVR
jgi:two-component system copper resistance phosphate regulon response regulator CusR